MSQLLEELIIDILSRLPAKSLLRFRCLSKSWCAFINTQDFINMHLQRSIHTDTNLNLIVSPYGNFSGDLYSYSVNSDDEVLDGPATIFNRPLTSEYYYNIIGSCNGLLCLCSLNYDLALWNPFTRRYKKLPTAPIGFEFNYDMYDYGDLKRHYGFGYDHVNNDYKVVRIIQFCYADIDYNNSMLHSEVIIYSLRLNSWKTVDDFPYDEYDFQNYTGSCFVSGASHWLALPQLDRRVEMAPESSELYGFLVAFDYGVEKFSMLPHPNAKMCHHLVNLGGLLCICEELRRTCVKVWVMKQYRVRESWFKLHSIVLGNHNGLPDYHKNAIPLAYFKNGEKLLLKTDHNAVTWYNLKEETTNKVSFQAICHQFLAFMCLESLVALEEKV